ncbi:MAG TPA: hypothetical protein VKA82_12560, partial [Rubrobacter sp.]|nr:hypothetical protein [Rubrobacter sp.]
GLTFAHGKIADGQTVNLDSLRFNDCVHLLWATSSPPSIRCIHTILTNAFSSFVSAAFDVFT